MMTLETFTSALRRPRWELFFRLRVRLFLNHLAALLAKSRLRLTLIIILSLVIWCGLYQLFAEGIAFIRAIDRTDSSRPSRPFFEMLFGTFFIALIGLMVFSNGLLLYASLFRSAETRFLLTAPTPAYRIYAHKFHEAVFFSGWAFVLLGSPLLVSYGVANHSGWLYYALLLPYLAGFLLLPAAIGGLACILIVALAPRRRMLALMMLLAVALGALACWAFVATRGQPIADHSSITGVKQVLSHLSFTQHPVLPSQWMTQGIMNGAQSEWSEAGFDLARLWGLGLGVYFVSLAVAGWLYRGAFSGLLSATGPRRRFGIHWSDRMIQSLLRWTDFRTRLFVLKDFRTFRRDPLQWAQVLILGAFLLFYFLSIPYMPHGQYVESARARIGLLNVAVVGLMLATFTSRFVFPLMSLEGRNFWVLGLLPLDRDRLFRGKLAFAATITLSASCGLTLVSSVMLDLRWWTIAIHLLAMIILSLGLSALSVGLGTCLVNLKESNPSKVATGYGGTINLLISLVFAVAIVLLTALGTITPYAVELMELEAHAVNFFTYGMGTAVVLAMLFIGLLAVYLPMRFGLRAFRQMEF